MHDDLHGRTSPAVSVRPLREDERALWDPLWKGYQAFYNREATPQTTDLTWSRLHDPAQPIHLLGGFVEHELAGFVHYLYHLSTWTPGPYCYLQDLYTVEKARKRGVGRALIEAVYETAREAGASRVYWLTHETNSVAMALYDQVAEKPGFVQYRKMFS